MAISSRDGKYRSSRNRDRRKNRKQSLRCLFVERLEDRRLMAVIDLAAFTSVQGTKIFDERILISSPSSPPPGAFSYSNAGDVNGDGVDDLIVGSGDASLPGLVYPGKSYLVFGSATPPASFDLATLGQAGQPAGITITGQNFLDLSGYSVSGGGDVNGDGFDDLFIGALYADAANLAASSSAGKSYVIFGGPSLPTTIALSDNLGATNPGLSGTTILGEAVNDTSGSDVSFAGDVNGYGFSDILVGARRADPSGRTNAGRTYVILGASTFASTINLLTLGQIGQPAEIVISGESINDNSGFAVSSVGDVNGDGFDDLVVGAPFANPSGRNDAGNSYVVFGGPQLPLAFDLAALGQSGQPDGIVISGASANDKCGTSQSRAGDLNGDGFDDFVVGSPFSDHRVAATPDDTGYILFGSNSFTNSAANSNIESSIADTITGTSNAEILIGAGGWTYSLVTVVGIS